MTQTQIELAKHFSRTSKVSKSQRIHPILKRLREMAKDAHKDVSQFVRLVEKAHKRAGKSTLRFGFLASA